MGGSRHSNCCFVHLVVKLVQLSPTDATEEYNGTSWTTSPGGSIEYKY
jgi:hypothetical protein